MHMSKEQREMPADSPLLMVFAGFIVATFAISVVLALALSFRAFLGA